MQKIRQIEHWLQKYQAACARIEELELLYELFQIEEASIEELSTHYEGSLSFVEELEFFATLNQPEDALSCMLRINAGAGGTESCDWASMLLRMYMLWAEGKGYKLRELHRQDGEVAGVKSVTIEIEGDYTYGLLKGEAGVHRLVRPSPFNAQGKRQTSFASVAVYALVDDTIEVDINPADLEWDTFRASGAGGQHVNKTESAVRVRHLPSGLVVECQQERSQHRNREKALQMLRSELYQLELERQQAERDKLNENQLKIEWGSQIRSYVLDDKRIKDHRSGYTSHNTKKVLDGGIDEFLRANLLAKQSPGLSDALD